MEMVIGLTYVTLFAIACIVGGIKYARKYHLPNKSWLRQTLNTTFALIFVFWVGVFLGLYAITFLISPSDPVGEGSVMYVTFALPIATPFYILIQFTAIVLAKPGRLPWPPSNTP